MLARGTGGILITPYETGYGPSKAFGYSIAETL